MPSFERAAAASSASSKLLLASRSKHRDQFYAF